MLEVTIDKLPGGDAARQKRLVRITLVNTGEGVGGVRTYEVRVTEAALGEGVDQVGPSWQTFREEAEGVLRLVHRALGRLVGGADPGDGSGTGG